MRSQVRNAVDLVAIGQRVPSTVTDGAGMGARSTGASARRPWLAAFAALNAFAAWAGAVGLAAGAIDFGEATNERLPFDSVVLAGLALATIVALPLTVLAWSAWTGSARTPELALLAGSMLIGWIVFQVVMLWAFSLFQPTYLCIGAYFVAASHRVRLSPHQRGILLLAVGTVLVPVGVGLLPHLVKQGLTVMSVVAVVVLLGGLACLVAGGRSALGGRRRFGRVAGVVATVVVLVFAVATIAPGVAATNVPATAVESTPAALGLGHEAVTLTTTDEVPLAAWYLPGSNGAAVVMLHGAGSTRSDVLDQAAALVGGGYGVLLLDARGHGDSGGAAMDLGWHGDRDIAAGTEYLASRPDIDPGRIGVVGFSMGGEEAIGAAATDPLISAVVAEGATGRRAADKDWYSDTYGARGWLQERLETVQDKITDFLTDASPPISLRSSVADAMDTRFLLIAAGNVEDEGHAADHIRSGASARVTMWTVDGADHVGGYDTQPEQWRRRVVDFLDATLG